MFTTLRIAKILLHADKAHLSNSLTSSKTLNSIIRHIIININLLLYDLLLNYFHYFN